jgi:hypothetical protein
MTPASNEPDGVPIGNPSRALRPIDESTRRRFIRAQIEAPDTSHIAAGRLRRLLDIACFQPRRLAAHHRIGGKRQARRSDVQHHDPPIVFCHGQLSCMARTPSWPFGFRLYML